MVSLEKADAYFELHLEQENWFAQTEQQRRGALQTASLDVAAALGQKSISQDQLFQVYAVCEQAIFLIRHPDANSKPEVLSEQIDGLGSRHYRVCANRDWSPRALRFIEQARGHFFRLSRG